MSKNPLEDLNLLQDVDFDPMQILHEQGGKITPPAKPAASTDGDDNQDDNKNEPVLSPSARRTVDNLNNQQRPEFAGLTDEQVLEGFKKTDKPDDSKKPTGDDNDPDPKNKKPVNDSAYAAHYQAMVALNEWEADEEFDGTKDAYIKVAKANAQKKIDDEFNSFLDEAFQENPDGKIMGKRLLSHLAKGGRVSDFVTLNAPEEIPFAALDDADDTVADDAARQVLEAYYTDLQWDKETVNRKLKNLEKMGGLLEEAKIVQGPYKKSIDARRKQHDDYITEQKSKNEKVKSTLNQSLLSIIDQGFKIGDVSIGETKKEREAFKDYIFMPGENNISAFSQELSEALRDPEFLTFAALSLKTKLYKDKNALGGGKNSNDALDKLESTLQSALLNKKIDNKNSVTPSSASAGKGNYSGHEFDLENAILIT